MKISTILDHIDSGHMALPVFQRGYVWNRDQVRGLMSSLYKRHPVGSLLVWATQSESAEYRGDGQLAAGVVKLLLDGQQRITSLYGVIRGKAPKFFEGNSRSFTDLYFHLGNEEFHFHSPVKMKNDPLWVDVTSLMKEGIEGHIASLTASPEFAPHLPTYLSRLTRVLGIKDIDLHIEEVTGPDKTTDVVVDIFNRVNSGGTKLSQGDLALAKICADWPEGREALRERLKKWGRSDYRFNLDWLLRNINTVVTGDAKFVHLHDVSASDVQDGLKRAERAIDNLLNLISGRLGLDHDRVLFGRYAFPVMVHYVDRRGGRMESAEERDKLLYWYVQSAMWGRFSGSTESVINRDLATLETIEGGLDRLIEELRLSHGSLRVSGGHFSGWSRGARFYPILYMLTRIGEAKDWGTGLPLKSSLLGKMNRLEVHHIFPKSLLYKQKYRRNEVNALANYCFLTKETNLKVGARSPEQYFPEIEERHLGALASQWIPMDEQLWKVENFRDFLKARQQLLAEAANAFLDELIGGSTGEVNNKAPSEPAIELYQAEPIDIPGTVENEAEEEALLSTNQWIVEKGLPEGEYLYELSDPESGRPVAILDLAWPQGLQEGYSQPVALLLNEGAETLAAANAHGFRYFVTVGAFKQYVVNEMGLGAEEEALRESEVETV